MENRKKISTMGLIALILVNFGFMADLAIIPAAHSLFTVFPDISMGVFNFIMSGSQLTALIATLLCAVLMRYFSKKTIVVSAFTLFTLAACLGAAIKDPLYIAVMRGVAGFGFGALVPPAMALINEIYHEDQKKCSMLVGFFDGSMAVIGAIMSIIAGWLAVARWDYVSIYTGLITVGFVLSLILGIRDNKLHPGELDHAEMSH